MHWNTSLHKTSPTHQLGSIIAQISGVVKMESKTAAQTRLFHIPGKAAELPAESSIQPPGRFSAGGQEKKLFLFAFGDRD